MQLEEMKKELNCGDIQINDNIAKVSIVGAGAQGLIILVAVQPLRGRLIVNGQGHRPMKNGSHFSIFFSGIPTGLLPEIFIA